jgi:hypothetical protein
MRALIPRSFHLAWNRRMTKKTVLAIGIEPSVVDYSAFPGLTPELVRNFIEGQIESCAHSVTTRRAA